MINNIQIIILAAGKGSRMKSNKPKVLQKLGGISLIQRIINTSKKITNDISIIYGFAGDQVQNVVKDKVNWIYQKQQNGTGSAIKLALPYIDVNKKTLILYGDVALISATTIKLLLKNNDFSLLTIKLENPSGYGRIKRHNNIITSIVEHKDCSLEELKINEVNTGIMAVNGKLLHKYIPLLADNNANNEFYLTDIIQMAARDNIDIKTFEPLNIIEVAGVNDRLQLNKLEKKFQLQQAIDFSLQGLGIIDVNRFDNRGNLTFDIDCEIDINTIFEGNNSLGTNVVIGANCIIKNSTIASNSTIFANSMIEDSIIGENVTIGPFARIRPLTNIKNNVKIGNFVETKKSTIQDNSKISHLSYIGDSSIGKNVNIGAGVITCNYDGINKHQTIIKDGAFIGSNSALVAPVKIGKNATIGAGSTINKDCEDDKLTLTRVKQISIKWHNSNKKS